MEAAKPKEGKPRKQVPVSAGTHAELSMLAILDDCTIQDAFDRYGAPAVAKALAKKQPRERRHRS